jgi:hypothetical protein
MHTNAALLKILPDRKGTRVVVGGLVLSKRCRTAAQAVSYIQHNVRHTTNQSKDKDETA